jgi:hypothetical protein
MFDILGPHPDHPHNVGNALASFHHAAVRIIGKTGLIQMAAIMGGLVMVKHFINTVLMTDHIGDNFQLLPKGIPDSLHGVKIPVD